MIHEEAITSYFVVVRIKCQGKIGVVDSEHDGVKKGEEDKI